MPIWITRRLSRRVLLVVGTLVTLLVFAASVITWLQIRRLGIEGALVQIEAAGVGLASQYDVATQQRLARAAPHKDGITVGAEPDDYRRLSEQLRTVERGLQLGTPIYTMTLADGARDQVLAAPDRIHPDAMEFLVTSAESPYWRHPYRWQPEMARAWREGTLVKVPPYGDEHGTWVSVYVPLIGANGSTSALLVVDHRLDDLFAQLQARFWWAMLPLGTLGLIGLGLTALVARRLARPIEDLAIQAERMSRGDYRTPIRTDATDEIGELGKVLEKGRADIEALVARMLGVMPALMVTIGRDGRIGPHCSQALVTICGRHPGGEPLSALPFAQDGQLAAALDLLYLPDSPMSDTEALALAPATCTHEGRTFAFTYVAIHRENLIDGVLLVGRDITDEVRLAAQAQSLQQRQRMILTLIGNRRLLSAFAQETRQGLIRGGELLRKTVTTEGIAELFRIVHTIKGSGLSLDLRELGEAANRLETQLDEARRIGRLDEPDRIQLALNGLFELLEAALREVEHLTSDDGSTIALEHLERERLHMAIKSGDQRQALDLLDSLDLPSLTAYLRPKVAAVVEDTAERTGKPVKHQCHIDPARVPSPLLSALEACMPHLLRNAIDHGLEDAETRTSTGKDPVGIITVEASVRQGVLVVAISDDGRGIDPVRIRHAAVAKGVIDAIVAGTLSDQECIHLILRPGFSTAEEITEVSGRGVGLDAVARRIASLGGSLDITSRPSCGSTFSMRIPVCPRP